MYPFLFSIINLNQMERPTTKDKKASDYIDFIENQLSNFQADKTNVRLYLGVKKQLDDMAKLLATGDVEVPAPTEDDPDRTKTVPIMSLEALSSKDDKFIDRYLKILDKHLDYTRDLKLAAEEINPKVLSDAEKEASKESGSVYERALNVG